VEPGAVTLAAPAGMMTVSPATGEERTQLFDLWQARRETEQRARAAEAFRKDDAIRAEQQAEEQREARIAPRPPRKIMQITFNPLQITSMTKVNQVVGHIVAPVTTMRDGKPVTSVVTRELTIPMPQFERIEYRGTILRYVD
jgi:hypothetical protein